ncbi:MAG: hypothetical protein CFE26_11355 [Verrucomicrobiales bacterium VVV1]|nr:MAG: hypothetical protein CFE26_11355 [Verrucomicrobiales bacterium VVV1]
MMKLKWVVFLGLGVVFQSAAFAAETRIWTSRKGSTLEAELLKADATSATLVAKDSKQIVLKIEDLSLADRQFLVEYGNADPKLLVAGELGEPEKQVKIDSATIKKLKDGSLKLGEESESLFELTESEHFLVASAGKVNADSVAETAERLWHGMAFQHMNFRRDWADKRMLIFLAEDRPAYTAIGEWYQGRLRAAGNDEAAGRVKATWDQLGSTSISLNEEMMKAHNLHPQGILFNIREASQFKKAMGPFQIHTIAGALLTKQLGGVSSFGSEGYFAVTTGHSYFKEIALGGKSETQLLSVEGTGNDEISSKKGFEDGSSWVRGLKTAVRKGTVKVDLEPMLKWKLEGLKPEELVLIYSFSYYMQSSPQRLCAFATMVRRIESSNQIPPAVEIAKIFGFDSVQAFNADWELFIKEGNFK